MYRDAHSRLFAFGQPEMAINWVIAVFRLSIKVNLCFCINLIDLYRGLYVYDDIVKFNKCAGREKLRGRPTLPKTHAEIIEMLETIILYSTDIVGARLVKDVTKDVVLLATDSSLQLLQSHSEQVFADGTFKYSPKHYY